MDGYLPKIADAGGISAPPMQQQTIGSAIGCAGTGLHSGTPVRVELEPAPAGTGIVFRRSDLDVDIPARFDHVSDTRLCTVLRSQTRPDASVGTIEHLMAALAGNQIDNIVVAVDGPELPILDGSAEPWQFLLDCAGVRAQEAAATQIEVLGTVRVEDGAAWAELRPGLGFCLELSLAIEFASAAIGRQSLGLSLRGDAFREIARARTFTQASEVAQLRTMGLARGGSLDNAIVVDGPRVINPCGLRMSDEFVRHKLLDAVGDLALGGTLRGRFVGYRSGHTLNNRLLRALFADPAQWRRVTSDPLDGLRDAA